MRPNKRAHPFWIKVAGRPPIIQPETIESHSASGVTPNTLSGTSATPGEPMTSRKEPRGLESSDGSPTNPAHAAAALKSTIASNS